MFRRVYGNRNTPNPPASDGSRGRTDDAPGEKPRVFIAGVHGLELAVHQLLVTNRNVHVCACDCHAEAVASVDVEWPTKHVQALSLIPI